MNLLTLEFWPLLILFLVIYYFVSLELQNILLVVVNTLFIAAWGSQSFIALSLSMAISFAVYLKIISPDLNRSAKKIWLSGFIIFQVCLLFYFKIKNDNFPLGISYYTFTIIAYLLEVFWKRTDLKVNLLEYVTSVSYFPIIMTGPIERLSRFSPQLRSRRNADLQNMKSGLYNIALGFFKITAISNTLTPLIQHNGPVAQNSFGLGLIIYCILSFFKLYAEFSGFIDVITGISYFLGLKISKNFNQPYFADNVNDVWKRWHMSLTSWLRDFVFMPLVLKSKSIIFTSVVIFILVAAWHGLNLNFLYWGIYWIIFYLIYLALVKKSFKIYFFNSPPLKIFVTLLITSLSTLSFIVPTTGIKSVLARLVHLTPMSFQSLLPGIEAFKINLFFVMLSILLMIAFESFDKKRISSYLEVRIILLFFLTALLGEFTLHSLLYLKV